MNNDEFVDKLIEEDEDGFNVFLDTLKDVFDHKKKKGKEHHD